MQVGQLQIYVLDGGLDETLCGLCTDLAAMGGRLDRKQSSQPDGVLEAMTYGRVPRWWRKYLSHEPLCMSTHANAK